MDPVNYTAHVDMKIEETGETEAEVEKRIKEMAEAFSLKGTEKRGPVQVLIDYAK